MRYGSIYLVVKDFDRFPIHNKRRAWFDENAYIRNRKITIKGNT